MKIFEKIKDCFDKTKEFVIYWGVMIFIIIVWIYVVLNVVLHFSPTQEEKQCPKVGPMEEIHCKHAKER